MFLSVELLGQLWPHATTVTVAGVSSNSQVLLERYGITELPQLIDFMAQCSEETGGGTLFVESGAYSAERAHEVWPGLFPTVQSAQAVVGNPMALFNKTYGGRLGNRPGTNDGYNFRGRGMIQITGRDWYMKISKEIGLDLMTNPDLAADPAHLLECALAFWKIEGVNALVGDFRAETKRINGGYVNMASREAWRVTCAKFITAASVNEEIKPVTSTSLPQLSTVIAAMPAPVSVAATPATDLPAVTAPLVIDPGSYASQFLTVIAPAVAQALGLGLDFVLNEMPMGSIVKLWLGPQVFSSYISQGITAVKALTEKIPTITIDHPNAVETFAVGLLHSAEADLMNFMGPLASQGITALVAKALPASAAPAAPVAGSSGKVGSR